MKTHKMDFRNVDRDPARLSFLRRRSGPTPSGRDQYQDRLWIYPPGCDHGCAFIAGGGDCWLVGESWDYKPVRRFKYRSRAIRRLRLLLRSAPRS